MIKTINTEMEIRKLNSILRELKKRIKFLELALDMDWWEKTNKKPQERRKVMNGLKGLAEKAHQNARAKGFWDDWDRWEWWTNTEEQ